MTIAEKLQTIAENEPKVYEAGREKGYREGYTDATSGTAFETDDSIAYRKIVPSASEKLAQVLKLGGMTYKTKNLIPYPYLETTHTDKGVTWTDNGDGSVTATGSATAYTDLRLAIIEALPNTTYVFSGMANTENMTFEISLRDESNTSVYNFGLTSKIASGKMVVNTANYPTAKKIQLLLKRNLDSDVSGTAYPMCNYGETALPYEPYFEGIRSAKVTELVSEGANKFNPNAKPSSFYGTSLEVLNNNTWRVTTNYANASSPYYYLISKPIPISGERFYIKAQATPFGNITKGIIKATLRDKNGTEIARLSAYANGEYSNNFVVSKSTYPTAEYIDVAFYASAGDNCDIGDGVEYSNIMVSFDVDVPYTPYIGTIATKPIPEALRNFLEQYGYGLGINETYHNYIDYERKIFVQRCKKIVFDGSENWIEKQVGSALVFRLTDVVKGQILGNGLCNKYEYTSNAQINPSKVDKGIYAGQSWVTIRDVGLANVSALKAQLATWYAEGNPLTVIYPLDTAIETDISAYLTGDSLIEVQGGGTITAVNEFELAAPSTIQFIKKVGA